MARQNYDTSLLEEILDVSGNVDEREDYVNRLTKAKEQIPYNAGGVKKRTFKDRFWGFIGFCAETLIVLVLLVALFAGWLIFYTGYIGHVTQDTINDTLDSQWHKPVTSIGEKHTDPAPVLNTTAPEGTAYATLWVPAFGEHYRIPIMEGTDVRDVLNTGSLGHYPRTGSLGQVGNYVLAGHRSIWGSPLKHIDDLNPGDQIVVETQDTWYVYTYQGDTEIVPSTRKDVLNPTPDQAADVAPTKSYLTLISSHPEWSVKQRYVARAEFSYWTPKSEGYPEALAAYTLR